VEITLEKTKKIGEDEVKSQEKLLVSVRIQKPGLYPDLSYKCQKIHRIYSHRV
jgi:hypothetical protein